MQPATRSRLLKLLGVAGVAGVAATGVAVARDQRRRAALEPDEVRARLRERFAEVAEAAPMVEEGRSPVSRPEGRGDR